MEYVEVKASDVPMSLLLEADPSEQSIISYLDDSWCFAAKLQEQLLGICVAKTIASQVAEIFNFSVTPEYQKQRIGSKLLKFTLAELRNKDIKRVELSTGTFGYQLTHYQRIGFRVDAIVKGHFLVNYSVPIYENGIQHKDMLRFYLNL